ncbi:MAG: serine hydrolase [Thermoanaerobaculia bacterium]|jgi:predicted alpha/beta hydrolase family esterase|nr:serine hydrolase [Thermoanaerobaculia bacterium]
MTDPAGNSGTSVLTIPGLWNSGPEHWQTHWEAKHPSFRRVKQRDFDRPDRDEWVATLDAAVRACTEPPVLASHSLGCSLVAQWAIDRGGRGVRGAFLVGPSDVEAPDYPIEGRSFSHMPLAKLPFPSIVVASTNDEFVSVKRAQFFANAWGSRLVFIGDAGHINGASGYGPWPEGERMLIEFCELVGGRNPTSLSS